MPLKLFGPVLAISTFACGSPAWAQEKGTLDPKPLPPLANPSDPRLPAKEVFGRAMTPVEAQARSIGYYWRGCLAGAKALPVDGESWQVVRLSRNRMWGNLAMIAFLERFSRKAKAVGVWNGILVGDISQPRGGPMLTGHASHQVGLDADVWLTPMPDHTLSLEERENMSAANMVTEDGLSVDRAPPRAPPWRRRRRRVTSFLQNDLSAFGRERRHRQRCFRRFGARMQRLVGEPPVERLVAAIARRQRVLSLTAGVSRRTFDADVEVIVVPPVSAYLVHPRLAPGGLAQGLLDRGVDEDAVNFGFLGCSLDDRRLSRRPNRSPGAPARKSFKRLAR